MDETYTVPFCWQFDSEMGKLKATGKGPQIIVVYTDEKRAVFLPRRYMVCLFLNQNKRPATINGDMNYNNFSSLLTTHLIPNFQVNLLS